MHFTPAVDEIGLSLTFNSISISEYVNYQLLQTETEYNMKMPSACVSAWVCVCVCVYVGVCLCMHM